MPRILLIPVFSLVALVVCSSAANAQYTFSAEDLRARMEQGIIRQRQSVENMALSIATQQQALSRQRGVSLAANFFRPPYVPRRHAPPPPPVCDTLASEDVESLVYSAAVNSSVEPDLIRGVMQQESAFRPCAVSPKGAVGLMQLEPATAADLGVKDMFDPADNVLGGARLLRQLMDRYGGDLKKALSAYNAGASKVDAVGGIPRIPETINYVNRILDKLPASSPLRQSLGNNIRILNDPQNDRSKAPSTIFWLMGNDGGK